MPYVVRRRIVYRGKTLEPGMPLGDSHPKRSLVTTKKVEWVPAEGEPTVQPIAKTGDRAVDHAIPAPHAKSPPTKVVETPKTPLPELRVSLVRVPTAEEVSAEGYDAAATLVVIQRMEKIRDLVDDGMDFEAAIVAVGGMPPKITPPEPVAVPQPTEPDYHEPASMDPEPAPMIDLVEPVVESQPVVESAPLPAAVEDTTEKLEPAVVDELKEKSKQDPKPKVAKKGTKKSGLFRRR